MPPSAATPADPESRRSPPWPVGRNEPTGQNVTDRATTAHTDSDRAVSPVLAVVLLVGLTVIVAALLGTLVFDQAAAVEGPAPRATFSIDAVGDRVSIVHEGGDAVAVGPLHIEVAVDGEPLTHQPPVPFFAAPGFEGGPTGPFNPSSDGNWTAGERASFRLAGTNTPALEPGSELTVDLFHDETRIASLTTRVAEE